MRLFAFTLLFLSCSVLATKNTNRVNRRRILSKQAKQRLPILSRSENKIQKSKPDHLVFFDVFDSLNGIQNGFSLNEFVGEEQAQKLKPKIEKAKDDLCRKTARRYAIQKLLYQELKRQHLKLRSAYRALIQELNAYQNQAVNNLLVYNPPNKFKSAPKKTRPVEPAGKGFSLKEWLTDKNSGYNFLYKLYSKIKDIAKPVQVQKKSFKNSQPEDFSDQYFTNDFYEYGAPQRMEIEYPFMTSEYENPFYSSFDYSQSFIAPQSHDPGYNSQKSEKVDQNSPPLFDPEIEVEKELEKDEKQLGLKLPKAIKKKLQKLRDSLKEEKTENEKSDTNSSEKEQNETTAEKTKKIVGLLKQKLGSKNTTKTENETSNTAEENIQDQEKNDTASKNEDKNSLVEPNDEKAKNGTGVEKPKDTDNKNGTDDTDEKGSSKTDDKSESDTEETTTFGPVDSSTENEETKKEEKGADSGNKKPKRAAQNSEKVIKNKF